MQETLQRDQRRATTAVTSSLNALAEALLAPARLSADVFVTRRRNAQGEDPPQEHFPLTWIALANLHEDSVDALLEHYGLRAGRRQDRLERLTQFLQET